MLRSLINYMSVYTIIYLYNLCLKHLFVKEGESIIIGLEICLIAINIHFSFCTMKNNNLIIQNKRLI